MGRRPPPHASASAGGDRRRLLIWLLPFSLIIFAVVAVPLHLLDEQGAPRYRLLRTELRDVRAANERFRREVKALRREVEALRTDPAAVERIARDELGMAKRGEIIFQFPD